MAAHSSDSELLRLLAQPADRSRNIKTKTSAKPILIEEPAPTPSSCPDVIEHLLEAALAHNNLNNFDEALKFLEAASVHVTDAEINSCGEKDKSPAAMPYFSLKMYILMCKGNVSQSRRDDEHSMLYFLEGWQIAKAQEAENWETTFLNAIGTLAYNCGRYEVACMCFHAVCEFRFKVV